MKAASFDYHPAPSIEEAVALLGEYGDEAKVLAGGQSLIPLLALRLARPEHVIDLNGVEHLAFTEDSDGLRVGALVRQRDAERSDTVARANPLLVTAVRHIGHPAIRNRGTIAGSIAHADPAAELPAVLLAVDGQVEATSLSGTRVIAAADFFLGFLTTALGPDELMTAVRFPPWPARTGWSFQEFSRRSGDFALAGVAAVLRVDQSGNISDARISFSGLDSVPVRAAKAEAALNGQRPEEQAWEAAAADAAASLEPPADIHGSAAYRRQLAAVLTRRALREAWSRAEEHK